MESGDACRLEKKPDLKLSLGREQANLVVGVWFGFMWMGDVVG